MINAKIIADSCAPANPKHRLTTFELDYPRFIHAELMTHRMFSRNAQSSRAVPVNKTIEVNSDYVKPIVWGSNKAGMSAGVELSGVELDNAKYYWDNAAAAAFNNSKLMSGNGLHKQWANRVTEPFSRIKVVLSATEFDNFFWLRLDKECVQPEFYELARLMKELYDSNEPDYCNFNEWHVPYVETDICRKNRQKIYLDSSGGVIDEVTALKISASCCAQVSYRKLDDSIEKALEIYDKLFSGPKPHLSPIEHQGKPVTSNRQAGVTHVDVKGDPWSGNFKNFVQYRQVYNLIPA